MEQPTKYDEFAPQYSAIFMEENQFATDTYHQQYDLNLTNKKFLDLGCGDGFDLNTFAKRGAQVYGIDASKSMVELATKNTDNFATIKEAYFEALPFADNEFDLVGSKYALQASANIELIYKEVVRVLKPGGHFVFLVGHPIYQFMEKRKHPKDYFLKEVIDVKIFHGRIQIHEPTHTIQEYLSPYFLQHFELLNYFEAPEDSIDKVDGDIYPAFLLIKARKKDL